MKLDLACGQRPAEGFIGVDWQPTSEDIMQVNLLYPPWPFPADSVDEVRCDHFVEHIPHQILPLGPEHLHPILASPDGWWVFFGELYRVMSDGATARFTHPYLTSRRAFQDPTHTRFITEATWLYLARSHRELERIDHYGADVDFTVEGIDYYGHEGVTTANPRVWDQVSDLAVTLQVHKP